MDKEESVLVGYVAGLTPKAWLCAYQCDYYLCCPSNSAHPAVALSLDLSSLWGKIHPLLRKPYIRRESVGINLRIAGVLTKRQVSICPCRFGRHYGALSWGMLLNMQGQRSWCQGNQRGKACLNWAVCLHPAPLVLDSCVISEVGVCVWLFGWADSLPAYADGNGSHLLCPVSLTSMGRQESAFFWRKWHFTVPLSCKDLWVISLFPS